MLLIPVWMMTVLSLVGFVILVRSMIMVAAAIIVIIVIVMAIMAASPMAASVMAVIDRRYKFPMKEAVPDRDFVVSPAALHE